MTDRPFDAWLEDLRAERETPLVKLTDGYFEFFHDGLMVYDFSPADAAHALRWLEHMARKSWVTKAHIEVYASIAATHYGAGKN